jgi:hypothetical protein
MKFIKYLTPLFSRATSKNGYEFTSVIQSTASLQTYFMLEHTFITTVKDKIVIQR